MFINLLKTFGLINIILTTIVSLCAIYMLVVIFAGLFFLMGF